MAVDTRDERAAILGYTLPVGVYPNADGSIGQTDRQQVAFWYPGILAAALAVQSGPFDVTISDVAAYALALQDTAGYAVSLDDTDGYTVTVSDN